jgi:nucleoid-associated protein YgaU
MFKIGSRYEKTALFKPSADGQTVFAGVRARQIGSAPGMIEHTVQTGDRLDLLARHYYNDDRLWWRIVDANPLFINGADMMLKEMEGQVILIPKAKE